MKLKACRKEIIMKKNILKIIVIMFMMLGSFILKTDAVASLQKWNLTNEVTCKVDNVTFCAYVSTDAKECWIYRAQIMSDTDTIKFPNEINGIAVTKIGGAEELRGETADDDLVIDLL